LSRNLFEILVEVSRRDEDFKGYPEFVYFSKTKSKTRYQTLELNALRDHLLASHLALVQAEASLYEEVRGEVVRLREDLLDLAKVLAELDLSVSMAGISLERHYCRPCISLDGSLVDIQGGRHVVVEALKHSNQKNFVENDCYMQLATSRFHFITGPNMGGKSTYLRQVALITLMAHCGLFVPATRAVIGVTDAIYTRIGSADNLSDDQSTFMMEMHETAEILRKATSRSLVIMDEIGRGTCHQEGLAIAWAVSQYLYRDLQCKTLFATHYLELGKLLLDTCPAIRAFQTTARRLSVTDLCTCLLSSLSPLGRQDMFSAEIGAWHRGAIVRHSCRRRGRTSRQSYRVVEILCGASHCNPRGRSYLTGVVHTLFVLLEDRSQEWMSVLKGSRKFGDESWKIRIDNWRIWHHRYDRQNKCVSVEKTWMLSRENQSRPGGAGQCEAHGGHQRRLAVLLSSAIYS
jgi:hypothetical protein